MKIPKLPAPVVWITAALAVAPAVDAQQRVPFNNGIPVAPELPVKPMPDRPVEYRTAEGQDIRVVGGGPRHRAPVEHRVPAE